MPDKGPGGFTPEERSLINGTDSIFRVLTIEDSLDYAVLRAPSTDLSPRTIRSNDFMTLCRLMLRTVTHPSQDGVGLAAPQIGINRRVIAVQRFDKPGEPFEVYPNIKIVWASDSLAYGPEGCLSVPDRREEVLRSQEIIVEYALTQHPKWSVRDTVRGYTAVIFQHEVDHLDGILYTDRL
ncbi:MAG: peptide deformylase [Bacteroidales bacterium]|nr:peptide deformylase [Bacteroidales bacterium]